MLHPLSSSSRIVRTFFVRGGLDFDCAITPEIEIQNIIMKKEILKFIESFQWVD